MPIEVECPSCAAPIKAPDKLGGKIIKCPRCQERILLPIPEAASESESPENPAAPTPEPGEATSKDRTADAKQQEAPKPPPPGPGPSKARPGGDAPSRLRISVLDGFRLGIGVALAGLLVGAVYLGGFWVASRISKSIRKEWDTTVDGAVAKTMGSDITMPNDPLPQLPKRILSLKAGLIWHGAKRGAHIVVTTHSFLKNPRDLTDIEEYLRAGQWMNYAKNMIYVLLDLSQSAAGGTEIEYAPGGTLKVQMNDGRTLESADLVKARRIRPDQGPWDPLRGRLQSIEALFDQGAVQPGNAATFVAFMPEDMDVSKVQTVYWHFSPTRRIKLQRYER